MGTKSQPAAPPCFAGVTFQRGLYWDSASQHWQALKLQSGIFQHAARHFIQKTLSMGCAIRDISSCPWVSRLGILGLFLLLLRSIFHFSSLVISSLGTCPPCWPLLVFFPSVFPFKCPSVNSPCNGGDEDRKKTFAQPHRKASAECWPGRGCLYLGSGRNQTHKESRSASFLKILKPQVQLLFNYSIHFLCPFINSFLKYHCS